MIHSFHSLPELLMADSTIIVDNLVKVYRETSTAPVRALDGISLRINKGDIFGLLGKNGAGKTTLLRILTTLIRPTSGSASICGHDILAEPNEVRKNICVVLQEQAAELYLSVEDNLATYARFQGLPPEATRQKIDSVIAQFGLAEQRNRKVIDLSGGLRRRVQVAKVFLVDRSVVFLDEPTTGMDPINARATLEALREQARRGRTIVLTTHLLHEAEELCDTIAIIDRGKCIAGGDLQAIRALASPGFNIAVTFDSLTPDVLERIRLLAPEKMTHEGNSIEMFVRGKDYSILEAISGLASLSTILRVEVTGASLEDVFLELLGDS
jgi:ABC-2 type transport system ATP-binding protein